MMQQLLLQLAPPPAPTLGNFVPGRNGAALQALCDIARGAGRERFVYLWGEPGSGRSHLLRGLAQAACGGKGLYLCATPGGSMAADNRIAADDVIAVDNMIAVDNVIAVGNVIAVDDVQDLSASDQIELFDLYNRVRAGAGALVASGDAAPAQLALREDLRSRLAWGLALQLHPLSDAEKAAALRQQARARALNLPEDVVAYLLRHARRDMASLIAILDALDRYSLEQKRPVTLPLVRDALESMKDTIYTAS
jgi:DnaA family protein